MASVGLNTAATVAASTAGRQYRTMRLGCRSKLVAIWAAAICVFVVIDQTEVIAAAAASFPGVTQNSAKKPSNIAALRAGSVSAAATAAEFSSSSGLGGVRIL